MASQSSATGTEFNRHWEDDLGSGLGSTTLKDDDSTRTSVESSYLNEGIPACGEGRPLGFGYNFVPSESNPEARKPSTFLKSSVLVADESVSAMEITHAARDASISSKNGSTPTVGTRVNDLSSSSEGVLRTSVFHSEASEETRAGEYTRTERFIPSFLKTSSPGQQGSDDPAGDQQGTHEVDIPHTPRAAVDAEIALEGVVNGQELIKQTKPPSAGVPNPGRNSTRTDIFNPEKVLLQSTTGVLTPNQLQEHHTESSDEDFPQELIKGTKPPKSGVSNPGRN
jgi:hypothetical protein